MTNSAILILYSLVAVQLGFRSPAYVGMESFELQVCIVIDRNSEITLDRTVSVHLTTATGTANGQFNHHIITK